MRLVHSLSLGLMQQAAPRLLGLQRVPCVPLRIMMTWVSAQPLAGQDLNEKFELYAAPERLDAPLPRGVQPQSLGILKARGDVHRDGDWHRSVHVWIHDGKGRLLLQQRSMQKDTNPGRWDVTCAGHITAGDGSLDTAMRELEEELGVDVSLDVLKNAWLCTVPSQDSGSTQAHGDYVCRELQDVYMIHYDRIATTDFKLNEGEVSAIKWLPTADVLSAWKCEDTNFVQRATHYQRVIADAILQGS